LTVGWDLSGVVVEVGPSVARFRPGDEVHDYVSVLDPPVEAVDAVPDTIGGSETVRGLAALVDEPLPLEAGPEAHRRGEAGHIAGKLVWAVP